MEERVKIYTLQPKFWCPKTNFENTLEKGQPAGNQHFHHGPQCFHHFQEQENINIWTIAFKLDKSDLCRLARS